MYFASCLVELDVLTTVSMPSGSLRMGQKNGASHGLRMHVLYTLSNLYSIRQKYLRGVYVITDQLNLGQLQKQFVYNNQLQLVNTQSFNNTSEVFKPTLTH